LQQGRQVGISVSKLPCKRLMVLLALALCTGSCTISREIRVISRGGELAIDFPMTLLGLIGLEDREYSCVDGVELFNAERLLWTLDSASPSGSCVDAELPIVIGKTVSGFIGSGPVKLPPGRYGVSVRSYAPGRVDFVLQRDATVWNIFEHDKQMLPPCGSYLGPACKWGNASDPKGANVEQPTAE
jgi:hypothetical protein